MKGWQKLICRASVVAGISFVSLLLYYGFPPTDEAFYIAILNFCLSFLFFINTAFENDDYDGDGKPDNHNGSQIKKQLNSMNDKKKELKKIFAVVPNLWFP